MFYIALSVTLISIVWLICFFKSGKEIVILPIALISIILIDTIIIGIDYSKQTNCVEIWSGQVLSVEHNEEWEEWIPPRTETYTTTDSEGKVQTHTKTIPGYWEHHDATNYVTTSDTGKSHVSGTMDGRKFTDSFVNSNKELQDFYPIGMPTASKHIYENKVQASYSIYKNNSINLKDYPDLPKYPEDVYNFTVNRFVGDIENKEEVQKRLNELNTSLNDTNNPNNIDKIKSYKQVNVIFVNLGDVPEEYGFALQNYWKNGNKNDFIIAFGTEGDRVNWCYPITWSEVEMLKIDVRDYMLDKSDLSTFVQTIEDIGHMVEKQFVRKSFSDFNYINIETGTTTKVFMMIFALLGCVFIVFSDEIREKFLGI